MAVIQLFLQLRPLLVNDVQRNVVCLLSKQITKNLHYAKPIRIDIYRHYKKAPSGRGREAGKEQNFQKPKLEREQLLQLVDVKKYNAEMNQIVNVFREDCSKLSSLQSPIASIESLVVKASGKTSQLKEFAKIKKTPKTVSIDLSAHPDKIKGTLYALGKIDLGFKPAVEGNCIFIPTDKISTSNSSSHVKDNKLLFIGCRNKIKNIQTEFIRSVQQNKTISPNDASAIRDELIAIADGYVSKADKIFNKKF